MDNATAPASAAVIVCADGKFPASSAVNHGVGNSLPPAALPAQTCHRQLCPEMDSALSTVHFLFTKEKQKKGNEVNERWQYTIWKRRWSAGAQGAPPANIPCETPRRWLSRVAELTEDLEELRSEKSLLCKNLSMQDVGAEAFRKDIATMETGLKKLEAREQKYSVELDNALTEYAELKAQAVELDPVELHEERQGIRPAQEKALEKQLEDAMHEKPSSYYAAQCQAGSVSSAWRGCRRAAGAADDHAAKEYETT